MNDIVNECLLTGDKFMPDYIEDNEDLLIALMDHLPNSLKRFKNLKKEVFLKIYMRFS